MVTVWGVYPVIVPSGIIFHWDANVGLGSLAFLIIVFRAMFFLLYIILVVLSPMEKCSSEGLILRVGVWLRGTFSESSESISGGVGGLSIAICTGCPVHLRRFRLASTFLLLLGRHV